MDASYVLMVQCMRDGVDVVARFTANTPFPHLPVGATLELPDCKPAIWEVKSYHTRVGYDERGNLTCVTIVVVDSSIFESGCPVEVVRSD